MSSRALHQHLSKLDKRHIWHPFTQMRDWLRSDPTVILRGKGACLWDAKGKRYLDANSSIWTNLHGHRHPRITRAIRNQLSRIAHSSALGLTNEAAPLLAAELVRLAPPRLEKVFFSDDGSTALEAALKISFQFWKQRRSSRNSKASRESYLSLKNAYHGDTVGAMSVSGIEAFHGAYRRLMFVGDKVMAPYCYRCPYNRAKPERADARSYRRCNWECISKIEKKMAGVGANRFSKRRFAAAVIEPLIQGAAGMVAHPRGYLEKFSALCRAHDVLLIADEVMTGFGRTGTMFACEQENVNPDFLCLAKGLTGGYLPLAATLTRGRIFNAFLGDYREMKTFFHGHSYTANQLGCVAGLANLKTFEREGTLQKIVSRSIELGVMLQNFWNSAHVGDVRQVGLVAGIELVKDWRTREPYPWGERIGVRVCDEARKRGVLTRPIGNVLVVMPPYCVSSSQLREICEVLMESIQRVCPGKV